MKLRKPHCNFCDKDLQIVRVDGSATGEAELIDITFEVTIHRDGTSARPTSLCEDKFQHTSNPIRYAALVESWVEDTATEVRCSMCTKTVRIVRIVPIPLEPVNTGNPLGALLQQIGLATNAQTSLGPFNMTATIGPNQTAIIAMIDSKFSEQELIDLLTDIGATPDPSIQNKNALVDMLIEILYH